MNQQEALLQTVKSVAKVASRLDAIDRRIATISRVVADLRAAVAVLRTSALSADVTPGSPALQQEEIIPVKIMEEDPARTGQGIYVARIQIPTGFGQFDDWLDEDTGDVQEVFVRGYPVADSGNDATDYPKLVIGTIVMARWEGSDDDDDFYHVFSGAPQLASHWVISSCTTGLAGVVKIKRTTAPESTTPVTGATEELAWLGTDAFLKLGDPCWAMPCSAVVSGTAVPWLIRNDINGAAHWEEPDTDDLSAIQDQPDAATLCDG